MRITFFPAGTLFACRYLYIFDENKVFIESKSQRGRFSSPGCAANACRVVDLRGVYKSSYLLLSINHVTIAVIAVESAIKCSFV